MLLLKITYKGLKALGQSCEKDKRIAIYPLIGQPWPMLAIIGLYLLIVLKWGPKFMANRQPYKIDGIVKIYNVVQIALNAFIFYEALKYSYVRDDFKLICQRYDLNDTRPETMKLVRPAVLYYASKYLDLLDTIFFLLRKKFNQISFLHVYHHCMMIIGVFIYCVDAFSSHFTATGVLNSFIHVCMYTYYLVAIAKPNIDLESWKRNLTRLQLAQFIVLAIFFAIPIFDNWCQLPIHWVLVSFLQNTFMIILFGNFYYSNYILKDARKNKRLRSVQ